MCSYIHVNDVYVRSTYYISSTVTHTVTSVGDDKITKTRRYNPMSPEQDRGVYMYMYVGEREREVNVLHVHWAISKADHLIVQLPCLFQ